MMLSFKNFFTFSKLVNSGLTARKYLRSISQSALLYRPDKVRELDHNESIKDRVVQQFFDSSSLLHRIQVFQSENRLSEVTSSSTPGHSYYKVILPFKQNNHLRMRMVQFFEKYVRVGRILELMDYIAANVAYRYCSPASKGPILVDQLPFITVTAAIDQIDFFHPILAEVNCSFSGYVSYVGKSSMEVQICVMQEVDGKQRLSCSAKFVMAARDKKTGKAYAVPQLKLQNQHQNFLIRNQLGQKRQKQRKIEATKALNISPPTYEESTQIHNLMIRIAKQEKQNKQNTKKWIKMSETVQRTTLLMHLQDKNLSGKIFGGFIIRLAYQLGWLTAYRFLKQKYPKCTHIDDVQFLGPVEVGSIVQLQSTVCYVDDQLMHVIVQCRNSRANGQVHLTNVLRINFEHETANINRVYPITLKQSSQYIQSMRRVRKYLTN